MKNTKKLLVVALGTLLITGCVKTPKLENGEEILASIDGKDYTANELYTKMKENYGTSTLIDMVDEFIIGKELSSTASEEAQAKSYVAQLKNYYESNGSNWAQILASNGLTEETLLKQYAINYEKETVAKNYYRSIVKDSEIEKYYKDEIIGDITAKQILITPVTTQGMSDEDKLGFTYKMLDNYVLTGECEDAEKKARQMIEEENIMRRARVESDEIRQKAQEETTQLRKNTLDFVDRQLMDADRAISEMLNAIRLERNEVRNRR